MLKIQRIFLTAVLTAAALAAQTPPSIQASGSATINVDPDQASLSVGVITQAATAQAAAEQNAAAATTMINALKSVLGNNGTIKTIYYSISPRYNNAQPAAIVGYTVSNTVQVIGNNINLVGPLIDAANQAGANNISGPNFGLQDPGPGPAEGAGGSRQGSGGARGGDRLRTGRETRSGDFGPGRRRDHSDCRGCRRRGRHFDPDSERHGGRYGERQRDYGILAVGECTHAGNGDPGRRLLLVPRSGV